ncbi:MAG: metallopeptidase family protein [Nocardioides sp.]
MSPITGRKLRDRHGRGMRGPGVVPRVPGRPELATPRDRFDNLVLAVAERVEQRCVRSHGADRLGLIEYAVEDAPLVPHDWATDHVPLASLVRGAGTTASRLVLFRRPIEHRCASRDELADLIHVVIVEQLADLLGIPPSEVDPNF